MALFGVSVVALFAFIYWSTLGYLERQTNAVDQSRDRRAAEQYERRNLRGFADVIAERVNGATARAARCTCLRSRRRPLAGNLPYWPRELDGPPIEWVDFVKLDDAGQAIPRACGACCASVSGFRLLVGPRHPRARRDQGNVQPRVDLRPLAYARARADRRVADGLSAQRRRRRLEPHDAPDHRGRPEPARADQRQQRRARRARDEHQCDARPDREPARRHAPRRRQRRARPARPAHAPTQSPRDRRDRGATAEPRGPAECVEQVEHVLDDVQRTAAHRARRIGRAPQRVRAASTRRNRARRLRALSGRGGRAAHPPHVRSAAPA